MLYPVYEEISLGEESPVSIFRRLPPGRFAYILESAEKGGISGRYSFVGIDPSLVVRSKGKSGQMISEKGVKSFSLKDNPLSYLRTLLNCYRVSTDDDLGPFIGGAVGYFGYDAVRFLESLPKPPADELGLPDMCFMITNTMIVFDHALGSIRIMSLADNSRQSYRDAKRKIAGLRACIESPAPRENDKKDHRKSLKIQSNFKKEEFKEAVRKAKRHIVDGDILQVVLSQRLKTELPTDPLAVYCALRKINPSPYMFYLKLDDLCLVGSSPEILVKVVGGKITYRPIAGTRPRGKTESQDTDYERSLLSDEKEKAEHMMLVDLGRNDVGRVAGIGTVKVTELMCVERYSHVMHIVSNIEAELAGGLSSFDALASCFPAGTVTGAPKIRAMEIIDELEPSSRGPYAGSVGYFDFSGNLDSCIAIRTILMKGNNAYVQAGAGIVADSEPESEYVETMNKAGALLKALEIS